MIIKGLLTFLAISLISGCASLAPQVSHYPDDTSLLAKCDTAFSLITTSIKQAQVSDAEGHPVQGYPYLRSNRFLASLKKNIKSTNSVSAWLDKMILLDQQAKTVEIKNLPEVFRTSLAKDIAKLSGHDWTIERLINECPQQFKTYDLTKPERLVQIKKAVDVPDDYSLLKRIIGFYPLTSIAVYHVYQQWKKKNLASFNDSKQIINWNGNPVVYKPIVSHSLTSPEIANMIKESRDTELNIPSFTQGQLNQLAEHFAPVFLVDELNDADKIGHPVWSTALLPEIDLSRPVSFVRLAYTWFNNTILPQLVYTIWFPERPKEPNWDILGGNLDGIIWRVTISNAGKALVADSIHPCGCYHLFFPAKGISKKNKSTQQTGLNEGIETPQTLPVHSTNDRITLHISAKNHYLEKLSSESQLSPILDNHSYDLIIGDSIPDLALRSMPLPNGNFKSLYQADGIVKSTERGERWLLWPMGIKSPGAMRQWGKHATVFVGRRHFDDPYLFDGSFMRE
jgi:hypothetical protein